MEKYIMTNSIKNTIEIIRHSAVITLVTLLLSILGCGGGGDGGDNLPPSADAGPNRFVIDGAEVTIFGSGTDSDGAIATYNWTQIEGSRTVIVSKANTATPTFTAPEVTGLLKFRLTVTDNDGATASDEVSVSVAKALFFDDFSDGIEDWTEVTDSGISPYWQVLSDEYLQQNNVENIMVEGAEAYVESYHRGTYSYLDYVKIDNKTSYRFSAEVTPLPNADGDIFPGNDVGVMFRYLDEGNYYRFTLNSRYGFSRLEKKVSGSFSTLAVDSAGYYEEETLNINIEVNGSIIQVYVNDDPLFSISDPAPITSGTIALYCQDRAKFDNVLVTENSPAPTVVISEPVAYSIATSDTLDVSAIATNALGGEVEFVLDNATSITVSDSPYTASYTAQFTGVSQGEHTVHAILRDSFGFELARDTNVQIGVRGDYYVAVGDSITNGFADNYSADNTSRDGRIIAIQGYEANLNDLLTSTRNYPHIVFNEGIAGDTSQVATDDRIDSILERHPGSNKVLILLGTNDSGSGIGGVDPDTFQANMQDVVNEVFASGKTAWVGSVPPIFTEDGSPNVILNNRIELYNERIALLDVELGPNFYDYFLGHNRSSLFADTGHPNGLGHAVMAYLWHNVLNPSHPVQPPLVLEDLNRPTYKQNLLEVGNEYYIDETFTLTDIPPDLDNDIWIMTANADRTNSTPGFLSFIVDRNVTVYVAYDSGAVLPDWLLTFFTDTGLQVGTTNGVLHLYSRDYASGSMIEVDGNSAGGGTGASNYIVIVAEK